MSEIRTGTKLLSTARRQDEDVIAAVRGEIDLHNSPELRDALLELIQKKPLTRLVLDLADVPYMDSSAVAVLVECLQKLRKNQGKLVLRNLQPRVRGLLEIARLDSIFVLEGAAPEGSAARPPDGAVMSTNEE
jgi:anti-sigma B factor antagonist